MAVSRFPRIAPRRSTSFCAGNNLDYLRAGGAVGQPILLRRAVSGADGGGFAGGIQNVSWTGTCSEDSNVTCNLQWAAACYTTFTSNCNSLGVKPCDSNQASQWQNSDHCGTPECYKYYASCCGACGSGGSCTVLPSCGCGGTGTLTNTAIVSANGQGPVSTAATVTINAPISISGTKFNDCHRQRLQLRRHAAGRGDHRSVPGASGIGPDYRPNPAGHDDYGFERHLLLHRVGGRRRTTCRKWCRPAMSRPAEAERHGGDTYYTICTQAGQTYTGNNFDDYLVPTCAVLPASATRHFVNGTAPR